MDDKTRAHHPVLQPISDKELARESWKIFQIMGEFVDGFERLAHLRPSVSIFGSARTPPDDPRPRQSLGRGRVRLDAHDAQPLRQPRDAVGSLLAQQQHAREIGGRRRGHDHRGAASSRDRLIGERPRRHYAHGKRL